MTSDFRLVRGSLGLSLCSVRVSAQGDLERDTWRSTRIAYTVETETEGAKDELAELMHRVDTVAESPKILRQSAAVQRQV